MLSSTALVINLVVIGILSPRQLVGILGICTYLVADLFDMVSLEFPTPLVCHCEPDM